jgi:single stranded DNA-binding protein
VKGIEAAFWGVLGKDPELRTSKTGNPFATMNVVVTVGKDDDGKDISQWVRVACFGQIAEEIAARAAKSDRIYCEGTLTLNTWADKATGEAKTGLNVTAWKVEKLAAIGKNRQFREKGHEIAPSTFKADARRDAEAAFKPVPEKRFELNDEIPF